MHGAGSGRMSFCRCAPGSRRTFVTGDLRGAMSRAGGGFVPSRGCRTNVCTSGRCMNSLSLGGPSLFSGRRIRRRLTNGFRTHRAMDSNCVHFSRGLASGMRLVAKLHVRGADLDCAKHACSSRASRASGATQRAGDCVGFLPSLLVG